MLQPDLIAAMCSFDAPSVTKSCSIAEGARLADFNEREREERRGEERGREGEREERRGVFPSQRRIK